MFDLVKCQEQDHWHSVRIGPSWWAYATISTYITAWRCYYVLDVSYYNGMQHVKCPSATTNYIKRIQFHYCLYTRSAHQTNYCANGEWSGQKINATLLGSLINCIICHTVMCGVRGQARAHHTVAHNLTATGEGGGRQRLDRAKVVSKQLKFIFQMTSQQQSAQFLNERNIVRNWIFKWRRHRRRRILI